MKAEDLPPGRLSEPPAPELIASAQAREIGDARYLYTGMSLADLAHVVMLIEARVVPPEDGGRLLTALLQIHPAPPLDFALDPARGDLFTNREAYLRMLTPAAGWLAAGRARREASTVAYRVAVRERLLALAAALVQGAGAALDLAAAHRATLFPDYTYLQPAQPTTFGHYLLTFGYPMLRDLERLRAAFGRTNLSPAGAGSVNGSRLPLDRARLAELLGFDGVVAHTRDAMWQADGPVEIAALLAAMLLNLDRLAEDLQIFSTAEFGLVQLADRHTRTSRIMPQKKNPYALAYVRGVCGESIGTLAAMAAIGKTPSGQIDNRMFPYGEVPRALDQALGALRLMTDVLRGLTVNTQRAAERAREDFVGAADLAEVIMQRHELPHRTAHQIVAAAVREALASGQATLTVELLEAQAEAITSRRLGIAPGVVAEALDPAHIIATRTGTGGAAEAPLGQMLDACRTDLEDHARWRAAAGARLGQAEAALLATASALQVALVPPPAESAPEDAGAEPPPSETPVPGSAEEAFDELFKDLPQPPYWRERRRWRLPPEG